jgi:putative endopeptidase
MGGRNLAVFVLASACAGKNAAPTPSAHGEGRVASPVGAAAPPVAALPAAQAAPVPGVPPAAGTPAENVTLADVGIEATSLDRSVDPCVDFYQFACGGWLASHSIPADRAQIWRFSELGDKNKAVLHALLEQLAAKSEPATQKLGDYYASCMDEAAIEKAGTAAVKPLLAKTMGVKDARSWLAALVGLHQLGIWVGFTTSVEADRESSTTNVTMLDSAALGLPDRDYYLNPDFKDQLQGYRQHVSRMLALAGVAKPEAAASDVIAIETELAKLTKNATEKRDVRAAYNPTDIKKLAKQTKSIDWKAYFKALGVTPSPRIVVGTPNYFANLDGVRKQLAPARWAGYFTYHALLATAMSLPKAFDDEAFALRRLLTGVAEKPPRFERCIDSTTLALGELLGRAYVDKTLPAQARQTAVTLVDALVTAMGDEIGRLDWMSEPTRRAARAKLDKLARMVGYPDKWRSYDFEVSRDDFVGNSLRAAAFETRRVLAKAGKPVDRGEWLIDTFTVDASYMASANSMVLPAGILQPPFFGQDRSVAANLGGIGMAIGHELTHGFDDQGAKFDAIGNLTNWWTAEDQARFEAKGKCLADQYSTFEAAPKQFVNGQLTLGENIADLGGVKIAFAAYRALRKGAPKVVVADGFSEDQQFFLAFAQAWCSKLRPAEAQRLLTVDPHAPPKFRVYGALRNLPEFSQAFQCAPGTPMHPARTCSVW